MDSSDDWDLYSETEELEYDDKGEFIIKVKKQDTIHEYVYAAHPFSAVGWDGYNYPYKFSILESAIKT